MASTCEVRSASAVRASPVARKVCWTVARLGLEGRFTTVVVPDADGFGYVVDEDLAVADLAGAGGRGKSLDDFVEAAGRDHHFDLDFGQQVYVVLLAAIDLFVAFLAPVTADFGNGHAVDADGFQRFFDFVQFERLDDCLDFLHSFILSPRSAGGLAAGILPLPLEY